MLLKNDTISRSWLITQVKKHKSKLIIANLIAVLATLISVPIPLLMPLMVDEVLLDQPAKGLD
ncbi:ABC transporter ATP-binding protein, partial [Vibrio parahaemolyticus]|nr:ABC transporter ATP-binding protein [Vibrio parahaemolyticus]